MLDTNVWSYIADEGVVQDLNDWSGESGIDLVLQGPGKVAVDGVSGGDTPVRV